MQFLSGSKTFFLVALVLVIVLGGFLYFKGGLTNVASQESGSILDRQIPQTTANLDSAARTQIIKNLDATIDALKTDPKSYEEWINLGLDRQILGDYEGARLAWEYDTLLSPSNAVAYANLGYLYMVYIKDYPKSEKNYLTAVKYNSTNENNYRSLFELYLYHYKQNTSAAEDILKAGIAAIPQSESLKVLLQRYQAGERNL